MPGKTRPSPGTVQSTPNGRRRNGAVAMVLVAVLALLGLYLVYRSSTAADQPGAVDYSVGEPGPSAAAPTFTLDSSTGGRLSSADLAGSTTLLYFQEGLTCQPCWDQMADLESAAGAVRDAGIDQIVSITTDPIDLIKQKVSDDGLSTQVLSDPNLAISRAYHANDFGMMGDSRDGHTFILVDPDGQITWRADYGGAPDFTMFVPVDQLLADLAAGRQ